MARSDTILALVRHALGGDRDALLRTVQQLIANERGSGHSAVAERLARVVRETPYRNKAALMAADGRVVGDFLVAMPPRRRLEGLVLSASNAAAITELVEEQQQAAALHAAGLQPRHRLLLAGAPGNGKTALAEALADALDLPLLVIRYEALIGSLLGETAGRLKKAFEAAGEGPCVLFFDEFDTVGTERSSKHETGEIKRVVSSLLMQVDDLPTHTVVVAATNHPEMLDRATWRRFQLRLLLDRPDIRQRTAYLEQHLGCRLRQGPAPTGHEIATQLGDGCSYAELEEFCMDVQRRSVLDKSGASAGAILRARVEQWQRRGGVSEGSQQGEQGQAAKQQG